MAQPHALIIDDNSTNIDVLTRLLEIEGVSYTTVQDVDQLDSVLANLTAVDVVFLDLEMPKLNGFEVLEFLRRNYEIDGQIVAYTVHTSEINIASKMRFDGFIGKPLNPDRFPDQLTRILNGERVWELP